MAIIQGDKSTPYPSISYYISGIIHHISNITARAKAMKTTHFSGA
jgi:hypothetical protein